jgi:hypothetical protein
VKHPEREETEKQVEAPSESGLPLSRTLVIICASNEKALHQHTDPACLGDTAQDVPASAYTQHQFGWRPVLRT